MTAPGRGRPGAGLLVHRAGTGGRRPRRRRFVQCTSGAREAALDDRVSDPFRPIIGALNSCLHAYYMYRAEALRVTVTAPACVTEIGRLGDTLSGNALELGEPPAGVSVRRPVCERDVSLLVLHGEAALDDALGGQLRGRGAHCGTRIISTSESRRSHGPGPGLG